MHTIRSGKIIAWLLGGALVAANVAGYAFHLYEAAWWFDRALHAGSLFALTFWLSALVFARGLRAEHRVIAFLLLAGVGIASGAIWELMEWSFDQLQPADLIKGKHDTMLDIVMDSIGAVFAAATVQIFLSERKRSTSAM